jgi:hypothetical protein
VSMGPHSPALCCLPSSALCCAMTAIIYTLVIHRRYDHPFKIVVIQLRKTSGSQRATTASCGSRTAQCGVYRAIRQLYSTGKAH